MRTDRIALATIVASIVAIAACSDSTAEPKASPFAGLAEIESNDSVVTPPPGTEAGSFHGVVMGLAVNAGQGGDTISNATKLAGVKVTAYPYLNQVDDEGKPKVGPEAASVVTDADGAFQLPTLEGGAYVVSFTPPDATWIGGWTVAWTSAQSNEHAWWIYLPRR